MLRSRPRPRLLVVSADTALTDRLTEALGEAFTIAVVSSAPAKLEPPAGGLVLLDEDVVDLEGCRRLRAELGADAPVAVITSETTTERAAGFFTAGMCDLIPRALFGRDFVPTVREAILGRLEVLLHAAARLRAARERMLELGRAQLLARLVRWELEADGGGFSWSDEATALFGIPPTADDGKVAALLRWVHPDDRIGVACAMLELAPHRLDYRLVLPDGRTVVIHQESELVTDERGAPTKMVGVAQDITELREAEQQVHELAYFDPTVRLPNRALLRRYLERALGDARRDRRPISVFSIGLDRFKRVNDVHGYAGGDELLRSVAARLSEVIHGHHDPAASSTPSSNLEQHLGADALLARIGGDEFVIVLERPEAPSSVARRIGEALAKSFLVSGQPVYISSSIGVASFPESGAAALELLERADTALHEAKARGRNNFQFFSQAVVDKTRRRVMIENALRGAMLRAGIGNGKPTGDCEFRLVYQPKIDFKTRQMVGAEALMRWTSAELGFVSPGEFIPIAEDAGLIGELGKWALLTACSQAVSWARPTPLHVSVNVSSRQFREPDFARSVQSILEATRLPPRCLELEVTEGIVMDDPTRSRQMLESLKALGVTIALDDFGTGYSSLSYLAKLPIDILKIDRSFVSELGRERKAGLITTAILGLARGLELDVVVEGVETEEQLAFVAEWAPITIQGYLFAKPMPLSELEVFAVPRPSLVDRLRAA